MIFGLDIGGANTKMASSDGNFTTSTYLPLWKGCDIEGTLNAFKTGSVDKLGVTITGELADCFATKKEGIAQISRAVKRVYPAARFYGSDGKFYSDTGNYRLFSAANWSASARFIGISHKNILFIDIGSTTTDIIPIVDGVPAAGTTDFKRLSAGELIYAGALRTNVAALLHTVALRGNAVRTSSELFAITGDVNLFLDHITGEDYTCDAPDNANKDKAGAALRLARVVCSDMDEMSMDDSLEIARQAYRKQLDDLKEGIVEVAVRNGLKSAIVCGMGDFLAREALEELGMPYTMLDSEYGKNVSKVFPAFAVARLLSMER